MLPRISEKSTQLLDLPFEMLEAIFGKLTYNEVAHSRGICKSTDVVCSTILNSGLKKAKQQYVLLCERNDPVAPKSGMGAFFFLDLRLRIDAEELPLTENNQIVNRILLYWIGTAFELLSPIYNEYIELRRSCFKPGRLLENIFSVLNWISTAKLQFGIIWHLWEILESVADNHFNATVRKESRKELHLLTRYYGCYYWKIAHV